jgi:hypothetical protein
MAVLIMQDMSRPSNQTPRAIQLLHILLQTGLSGNGLSSSVLFRYSLQQLMQKGLQDIKLD